MPSLHERVTICGGCIAAGSWRANLVNLRDASGIVQVVFEPALEAVFALALTLRLESVIVLKALCKSALQNEKSYYGHGDIEVLGHTLTLLNASEPLPFYRMSCKKSARVRTNTVILIYVAKACNVI